MSESASDIASPIRRVRIGVATHVAPPASLSGNESLQDLLLIIDECIDSGEIKIIVDLAAVQVIDSLAITALMDIQDRLMKLGGWIKVTGHNSIVREVAQITGLADYVTFLNNAGGRDRTTTDDVSTGPGARLGDILIARKLISEKESPRP